MTLSLAILIYILVQLAIGIWAARFVRSEGDYLLAGRTLGVGLAMISLFATWFGAETVMGSSAAVAEQGLAGSRADPFGYTICLVLMALLLAYRLRAAGYVTVGDFFKSRYSVAVEKLAVIILVPTSVIWAAAQLLAFGQVLAIVSDVDLSLALIVATALVILYTFLGGLLGDVITDALQGGVMIIGLVILLAFVFAASGGLESGLARIEPRQLSFVAPGESMLGRFDTWMIPILGSLVSQEALARLLAARTPAVARRACYAASGLYLVVGIVPVLIALIGTHIAPELGHRDEFLPQLAQSLLPTWLFAILMGALVSAILSTVDSTLLTVAALVSHNILGALVPRLSGLTALKRFLPGWLGGKAEGAEFVKVFLARMTVIAAGIAAYFVAVGGENIYELVQTASSFGTAGILVTVVIGLWTGYGGPYAALAALLAGAASSYIGNYVLDLTAPFLSSVAVALPAYLIAGTLERRRRVATYS